MKRIAVISNCQGEGLALCLKTMNPDIRADFYITTDLQNGKQDLSTLLQTYDLIFAQTIIANDIPIEFSQKVFYFPVIAFSAFHPDMTYLRGKKLDGSIETVESQMVIYHSSIAIFGYLHGLNVEQTLSFYNPYVFSRLGYFDNWNNARKQLLEEAAKVDFPLNSLLSNWEKRGCFMYSFNHPYLHVMSDIANVLMQKVGIPIVSKNCSQFLADPLQIMPVWPIYPEIATRYGLEGDYAFKRHHPHGIINLRAFVESSYIQYAKYERESLEPLNFRIEEFNKLLGFSNETISLPPSKNIPESNPYKGLPDFHFWKKSLATVPIEEIDPVVQTRFKIFRSQKIATAGSCFAQHIARTLSREGFNYFITEPAPNDIDIATASTRNYGVFSARYGNIYTARQLVQLINRVYGKYTPEDQYWLRKDGRCIDPFRPQIEPEGFINEQVAEISRQQHFSAVRTMLEHMDVFIFTLGLTEGWRSRHDGAVFPLAPGVVANGNDFTRYEFVNFDIDEVTRDVETFLEQLSTINPKCKVILTVSPVPLIATYEPQHVLLATTYSKAILRVAAENIVKRYAHVDYFPSYEIITGNFNKGRYFADDLRTVTDNGVAHVMRIFLKHYMHTISFDTKATHAQKTQGLEKSKIKQSLFDIVCDEEAIARF